MMRKDSLEKVLRVASLCTSDQNFVSALRFSCFSEDGTLHTYNDAQAVVLPTEIKGLDFGLPCDLFLKLLGTLSETAEVEVSKKGEGCLVKSSKTKVELPVLGSDAYLFDAAKYRKMSEKGKWSIEITQPFILALEKALFSVGSDPSKPSTQVITLVLRNSHTVAFSTDGTTVTAVEVGGVSSKKRKEGIAAGMDTLLFPPNFVRVLRQVFDMFPDDAPVLTVLEDGMLVVFEDALVYTKTPYDADPINFTGVLESLEAESLFDVDVPPGLDSAAARVLIISPTSTSVDGAINLVFSPTSTASGVLTVSGKSASGASSGDKFTVKSAGMKEFTFSTSPDLVVRGVKQTQPTTITVMEKAIALKGDGITHYISSFH
jgi:hypothetical protein